MTRHLAPLAVLIALPLAGCGSTVSKPRFAIDGQTPEVAKAALAGKRVSKEYETTAVKTAGLKDRLVGDYVVFKFSGAFRKGTIQLTETVVAHEGDVIVVDFAMLENIPSPKGVIVKEQTLRAKIDTTIGSRGEVFGVQKVLKGGALEPATVAEWEAMMAKTVLTADANEQTYGTEEVDMKVLGKTVTADRTAYKVIVNGKPATMTITASDNFVWGDLAGDIIDDATGNVLYKAELVDSGHTIQPFFATDDDGI